jgi:hypothetical protein
VERGGFVPVPTLQHPALFVAVPVAVHVDAATVMQFERVVLDLLPVFLDNELVLLDPRQQAVGAMAVFLQVLFGQQPVAVFLFLALPFFLRVHFSEDHQMEAGSAGEFKRQPVYCLAGGSGRPGAQRIRSAIPGGIAPSGRVSNSPSGKRIEFVFLSVGHHTFPCSFSDYILRFKIR